MLSLDRYHTFAILLCLAVFLWLFLRQRQYAITQRRSDTVVNHRLHTTRKTTANTGEPVDSATTYRAVFPPSRHPALAALHSVDARAVLERSHSAYEDERVSMPALTPADELRGQHMSATGFTTTEISELGDFPDYATLSGVPLPQACPQVDVTTMRSRPYRPFRWAYHQTMSLSKMEPDWWLEIDSEYATRVQQRLDLFEAHGSGVLQILPGCEMAAKELMEMALQFLCARYPAHFQLDRIANTFRNHILHAATDLTTAPPLHVLLRHVPEDFALMLRDPQTGQYHFRGGIICSSLGWNLASKISLPLHEIHAPVPHYAAKMRPSMDRYFARLPTDKPIQRGSWGLEIDRPLYMPAGHAHERLRERQDPTHELDRCHLRVDWQTLRRLPLSGAVVFNFKALFTPVRELRDEAYIPALLLWILEEGDGELMAYKNTWHTEHIVIPALREWKKEQEDCGLVERDWQAETLAEAPFWPGWERKWRDQQKSKKADVDAS